MLLPVIQNDETIKSPNLPVAVKSTPPDMNSLHNSNKPETKESEVLEAATISKSTDRMPKKINRKHTVPDPKVTVDLSETSYDNSIIGNSEKTVENTVKNEEELLKRKSNGENTKNVPSNVDGNAAQMKEIKPSNSERMRIVAENNTGKEANAIEKSAVYPKEGRIMIVADLENLPSEKYSVTKCVLKNMTLSVESLVDGGKCVWTVDSPGIFEIEVKNSSYALANKQVNVQSKPLNFYYIKMRKNSP